MMAKMIGSRRFNDCEYDAAERIKSVFSNHLAIAVDALHKVPLEVCNAVVNCTVVLQHIRLSVARVEKIQDIACVNLLEQSTAGVHIKMLQAINSFACLDTGMERIHAGIELGKGVCHTPRPLQAVSKSPHTESPDRDTPSILRYYQYRYQSIFNKQSV